jgi:phosphate transport system permease protein
MKHARGDAAFRWTVTLSGVAVLGVLALMIISTTLDALPVLRSQGLGTFLTGTTWDPGGSRTAITGTYQAGVFLYGTLVTALIALLLAVPVSLGIGLFLSDIAHPRVRGPFVALIDLLAAIPSVVYGLWGLHFFAPVVLKPTAQTLSGGLGWIPLVEGPVIAFNVFYAGVVLAIMVLPIITSIAREVFSAVPDAQRHAAYAVGATRGEVGRSVVLPRSRPGIIGAIMLGLGRALGETIAVALLVGGATAINTSIFQPGETVASKIVNTFQESAPEAVRALIALGVTLFAITIVINIAARLVVRRMGDLSGEAVA